MASELHKLLIQTLSTQQDLLKKLPKKTEGSQWQGYAVSQENEIKTEIHHLLNPENSEELTDTHLLNRICTICDLNDQTQKAIETLYTHSVEETATTLAEALINSNNFYETLDTWVSQAQENENRVEAAEKLSLAFQNKDRKSLSLKKLGLKTLPNVFNHLEQLERLDLSHNELTTLPNGIKHLTQLENLILNNNQLKTLPDIFNSLPQLEDINLDNNLFQAFPNTLYSIDHELSCSIDETPLLYSLFPPALKLKISENNWDISGAPEGNCDTIFTQSRESYLNKIRLAKNIKIKPQDYDITLNITNVDDLDHMVKELILRPEFKNNNRIETTMDFTEKISSYNFDNMRYLSSGDSNSPINVFGCASPMSRPSDPMHPNYDQTLDSYLKNLSFVYQEVDTMIALMERNPEDNTINDFVKNCSGDATYNPIKVLSMPISDFVPPRFEHYLTLTEEMTQISPSDKPRGIFICCFAGEGRTGTLLAATQVINEFKKLDSESRKNLLHKPRDHTPKTFEGVFTHLWDSFTTTSFVGKIVENLRQLEHETTTNNQGLSVETPAQFQTLEMLQCMLAISERVKEGPPMSDEEILGVFNENHFKQEVLEEFFQIDYLRPKEEVILEAVKKLHTKFSNYQ